MNSPQFAIAYRRTCDKNWSLAPYPWDDKQSNAQRTCDWLRRDPQFRDTELFVVKISEVTQLKEAAK